MKMKLDSPLHDWVFEVQVHILTIFSSSSLSTLLPTQLFNLLHDWSYDSSAKILIEMMMWLYPKTPVQVTVITPHGDGRIQPVGLQTDSPYLAACCVLYM